MSVSLVINTLNEEANIADCIASVGDLADEIVVCDMHSEDCTREIAESLDARVFLHERLPFVEGARRYAIEQASSEWVLVLDADERMTPELCDELREILRRHEGVEAVRIGRLYQFMGKYVRYGTWGKSRAYRFFKRNTYLERTPADLAPVIHLNFPGLRGCPGTVIARSRIVHLAYPSLHKFTYKTLHYYSYVDAASRFSRGERAGLFHLVFEPLRAVVLSYLVQLGFLDGPLGFVLAICLGMYHFLTVAHVLELQGLGKAQEENGKRG